jgi:hypothetical protein
MWVYTYRKGFLDTEESIVDQPKEEEKDGLTGTNLSNLVSRYPTLFVGTYIRSARIHTARRGEISCAQES